MNESSTTVNPSIFGGRGGHLSQPREQRLPKELSPAEKQGISRLEKR